MTSEAPEAPSGFVHAGPVSDFIPRTVTMGESLAISSGNDVGTVMASSSLTSPPVGCPGMAPENSEKRMTASVETTTACGQPIAAIAQIKVIEVPQPEGRYPPKKRVAVTHFHGKWYAFINVSLSYYLTLHSHFPLTLRSLFVPISEKTFTDTDILSPYFITHCPNKRYVRIKVRRCPRDQWPTSRIWASFGEQGSFAHYMAGKRRG